MPMAGGYLESLLSAEPVGTQGFRARLHDYGGVAFGGDVLARATLAAGRSCPGKSFHALHAAFLRPLTPGADVALRVVALSDGRRIARRRVDVLAAERLLCQVTASFSGTADGPIWQEALAPDATAPESLRPDVEVAREQGWRDFDPEREEFEWRWETVEGPPLRPRESAWRFWLRPRQPLPPDPVVHAAAVAYASDLVSHASAVRRLGRDLGPPAFASLDHAIQIHRPRPWDDWWLCCDCSDVAGAGRAFWQRRIFARDGALVATIGQDAWLGDARTE